MIELVHVPFSKYSVGETIGYKIKREDFLVQGFPTGGPQAL